jgi:hypothetical protein
MVGMARTSSALIAAFPGAYSSWQAMKSRCRRDPRYVGRVSVCERWLSFAAFVDDMGERPAGRSIEREDNEGDYEPGNCVWATRLDQMRNTRRSPPLMDAINGRHKPPARPRAAICVQLPESMTWADLVEGLPDIGLPLY